MAVNRVPRLVSTGHHVDLSNGYPGLRGSVTYEDDPGWLHERLLLWVIEPVWFVVLTPDGDTYEEMGDTWLTAQVMAGRRHIPIGPANVVAFTLLEDAEMLQHITEGRLDGKRISAAESLTVNAGLDSYFNWSGELKTLSTPGAVARVSHRLRGRRASVEREILPVVTSEDIAIDRSPREVFEFSGNERTVGRDRQSCFFSWWWVRVGGLPYRGTRFWKDHGA